MRNILLRYERLGWRFALNGSVCLGLADRSVRSARAFVFAGEGACATRAERGAEFGMFDQVLAGVVGDLFCPLVVVFSGDARLR